MSTSPDKQGGTRTIALVTLGGSSGAEERVTKEYHMELQQYSLGHQKGGSVVEVSLSGNAANVQLLDNVNLQNYKAGLRYNCYGGHYTQSPIHITVPHTGTWYVTIDLGGYAGQVRSSVRVIP